MQALMNFCAEGHSQFSKNMEQICEVMQQISLRILFSFVDLSFAGAKSSSCLLRLTCQSSIEDVLACNLPIIWLCNMSQDLDKSWRPWDIPATSSDFHLIAMGCFKTGNKADLENNNYHIQVLWYMHCNYRCRQMAIYMASKQQFWDQGVLG